ncbi:putative glutathione S-transferase family protein [Emericellopsis atlantica]|uniref:Glutathione S-transferase family protein n=1 Tax=Emericellopsis atlantica TaxID=2614577 RepID=A0A9P8CP27_9HYPO|nr:putative glutathione S-transferase family protein [Emericellopsis atlantica]KAG9253752.1 putative glutathione S-transferase family protein [Emericellopsis atlantica]
MATEPDSKRSKTGDSPAYELVYWPGLPGRGEFIRLLFEEAQVAYTDTAQDRSPDKAVELVMHHMTGDADAAGKTNPPVFAPPALVHGDNVISQTPNIMQYLAPRLGLLPKDDEDAGWKLNQIVLTLLDGFVAELHDTHHPIAVGWTYEEQKPEAKKRAANFVDERLPKFLGWAQRVLDSSSSGEGPWLQCGQFTYADLVLFQCVHGTSFAFPKRMKELRTSGKYDKVFALYEAVGQRPNIKAYMESDRRQEYGNGIWRYYAEFEE